MREYNIMSKDIIVGAWRDNSLTVQNKKLLPIFLREIHDSDLWLKSRAIDSSRANSRLLKKALKLKDKSDLSTSKAVYWANITDNYLIKPLDSNLEYKDIKPNTDSLSDLALVGDYNSLNSAYNNSNNIKTPELTNIGSFEKCWKLIDNNWWLYKKANEFELLSELFVYNLSKQLNFETAEYRKAGDYIASLDFTYNNQFNFEPAYSFMRDNEDYNDTINKLKLISNDYKSQSNLVESYIKLIYMDTLVANPDRHTFNFGVLRDTYTGNIVKLAPNFDNNMALISRGYPSITNTKDILIDLFTSLINSNKDYLKYIKAVRDAQILKALEDTTNINSIDLDRVFRIIYNRNKIIEGHIL